MRLEKSLCNERGDATFRYKIEHGIADFWEKSLCCVSLISIAISPAKATPSPIGGRRRIVVLTKL